MKIPLLAAALWLPMVISPAVCWASGTHTVDAAIGMRRADFLRVYPKTSARTYRSKDNQEWITYNRHTGGKVVGTRTYHFVDGKLVEVTEDDWPEVADEYLSEYCSQGIILYLPKMYTAIRAALLKLPPEAFLEVTDRVRPVLFTEYHTSGTARFANSSEIIKFADDAPSMMGGLTIVKLGTDMEEAESTTPIEGVILHELAHRVLEHARQPEHSCRLEREANDQVKKWGYTAEFEAAKARFGSKRLGKSMVCE